jgi:hypothetical protein
MRELTLQQLAQHDGSNPSLPMMLSIRGVVYDITSGKQFYGPDGELAAAAMIPVWQQGSCSAQPIFLPTVWFSLTGRQHAAAVEICRLHR